MKPFEQATQSELRALWEEKYPQGHVKWWPNYGYPYVFVSASTSRVDKAIWGNTEADMCRYYMGLVFHDSDDGMAVAQEAAKRGIIPHPGMDWQADLKKVKQFHFHGDYEEGMPLLSFLNKYS